MLNTAIANPALLETNGEICTYEPTAEVILKENEIGHMMNQAQPDFDRIQAELLKLASAKYDCCVLNDRQQATEQLTALLTNRPQLEKMDIELFQASVKAIRVSHCVVTELELINGICLQNITERSETP